MKKNQPIERQKFFALLGKGLAGAYLLSLIPLNAMAQTRAALLPRKRRPRSFKVVLHPSAVKRNQRG